VSFVDWALAVHVLSAFAFVAGLVLFWVLIVAVRRVDTPEETLRMEPIVKVGNVAVGLGAVGTIVVGIYLAFAVDSYAIWDGWIIAALVLWAVAGAVGQRTGAAYMQGMNKAKELDAAGKTGPDQQLLALNRTQAGVILHTLASLAMLLVLLDMIFKPGA
jgi:drug/metabolite transporter (DMT)-like permease